MLPVNGYWVIKQNKRVDCISEALPDIADKIVGWRSEAVKVFFVGWVEARNPTAETR